MGSDRHYPEEAPAHQVRVDSFAIDTTPVTNRSFGEFVAATGYVTLAEKAPRAEDYPDASPALLVPGGLVFTRPEDGVVASDWSAWWRWVPGACWRHPLGPVSDLTGLDDHPVVQIACEDAEAYAAWAGMRLPTEAEWEYAARGGLAGKDFAWGDELAPAGRMLANTWQGRFPVENLLLDGFERTSPVGHFPANGYGLFDMIGNVWEWTADWYAAHQPDEAAKACCVPANPRGGERDKSLDPHMPGVLIPRRVIKGGSHLCAPNYCQRYRPAARQAEMIDSATSHIGFRCAADQDFGR